MQNFKKITVFGIILIVIYLLWFYTNKKWKLIKETNKNLGYAGEVKFWLISPFGKKYEAFYNPDVNMWYYVLNGRRYYINENKLEYE